MLLTAKVLLTLASLGYSAIPVVADFNETHATNPKWMPHARFHVVWQVSSYVLIAVTALLLIWLPGDWMWERLWIATGLAASIYIGFFTAVATKQLYGGANFDTNGIQPIALPFGLSVDVNIAAFSPMVVFLIFAIGAELSLRVS
jgi:hypothetical protein